MAAKKGKATKGKKKSDKTARLLTKLAAAGVVKHSLIVLTNSDKNCQLSDAEKVVEVEISAEEARAWINGVPLELSGGKGSCKLLPGHHILSFELRGAPGTKWSVKITAPSEAKAEDGGTFDGTGFEAGRIKFVVNT